MQDYTLFLELHENGHFGGNENISMIAVHIFGPEV